MDDEQDVEEGETQPRMSGSPNPQTFIVVGTAVIGTTLPNVVNQVMPGQPLWLRMFVGGIFGAVMGQLLSNWFDSGSGVLRGASSGTQECQQPPMANPEPLPSDRGPVS
jgi:hypothetical protein